MRLVQFSTRFCGPCRISKSYLSDKLDSDKYVYIDVHNDSKHDLMYLLQIAKRSAVPQFFLLGERDKLLDYWVGYSSTKLEDVVQKLQTAPA